MKWFLCLSVQRPLRQTSLVCLTTLSALSSTCSTCLFLFLFLSQPSGPTKHSTSNNSHSTAPVALHQRPESHSPHKNTHTLKYKKTLARQTVDSLLKTLALSVCRLNLRLVLAELSDCSASENLTS